MATLPPPVVLKPEGSDEESRPVQTTPHQTDRNPDAKGARGGGIDCGVSTPALAGPGQPEAPPSPHLDRWPGTLKPHPPVFLAPGPVLGAQQFRSRPRPRARPCPRSLFNLHFHFLTLSIRPTLPVAHTIIPPCIALQRSQDPKPPRPRTSLLRARHGGASKQPKHTDPTSPPAAAVSPEAAPNPKTPSIPHQQQPGRPPAPPVRGLSPRPGPGGKAVPAAVTLAARRTTTSLVRPACC